MPYVGAFAWANEVALFDLVVGIGEERFGVVKGWNVNAEATNDGRFGLVLSGSVEEGVVEESAVFQSPVSIPR